MYSINKFWISSIIQFLECILNTQYLLHLFQLKAQLSKVTTETSAVTPSDVLRKVLRDKQVNRNGMNCYNFRTKIDMY